MKALILAAAPCVFDDARRALACGGFDAFYVVNAAGMHWPLADWWVTGHPEALPRWRREREAAGWPMPPVVSAPHKNRPTEGVDRWTDARWPGMPDSLRVTSALLAVKAALEDGAGRVVICGAPLGREGGHIDPDAPQDHDYARYRHGVQWAAYHAFADRVRGTSGYPAKVLGEVTREWLR